MCTRFVAERLCEFVVEGWQIGFGQLAGCLKRFHWFFPLLYLFYACPLAANVYLRLRKFIIGDSYLLFLPVVLFRDCFPIGEGDCGWEWRPRGKDEGFTRLRRVDLHFGGVDN